MARYFNRDTLAIVAALVGPLLMAVALVPWRTSVSSVNAALVMVVVVVAVAANGSRLAGALAALSAAVWFDFFLTEPFNRFTIADRADIETTVLLLIVGLAVSQLATRVRQPEGHHNHGCRISETNPRHRRARPFRAVAAGGGRTGSRRADRAARLHRMPVRVRIALGDPPRLERDGSIAWSRRHWDVDRLGLPQDEVELRAFRDGSYYGRFMLRGTPGAVPPLEARLVAVTLADQVGATKV